MKEYINFSQGPLPNVESSEASPFWEGTRQNEIRFPKCQDCNQFHWYPCTLCPFCHSPNIDWQVLKSQPRLFTWTQINWIMPIVAIRGHLVVILVEFDEASGLYFVSNLVDCEPKDVYIGMPLEAVFQRVNEKLTMPLFKPMEKKSL